MAIDMDTHRALAIGWERHQHARRAVQNPYTRPNREPVAEYRPDALYGAGGLPGIIDEMAQGHPKIARALADMGAVLGSLALQLDPVPGETWQDAELRRAIEAHLPLMAVDAEDGMIGLPGVMTSLLTWYTHGLYVAELRWVDIGAGLQVEAFPVHPSSIQEWRRDGGNRLAFIRQQTQEGAADIPADRLLWIQRGGVPGQYGGTGWLRPLAAPFGLWRALMTLTRRNVALHGGTVEVREKPGATETARRAVSEALTAWQVEGAPWVVSPHGTELVFHAPGSGSLDITGMLAHLDSYIDTACGQAAQSLAQAAHATRALGEVLSDSSEDIASREMHLLLQQWMGGLARWMSRELGIPGRAPVLTLAAPPMEREAEADIPAIVAAQGAGLLGTWTPADAAAMRDRLGLPQLDAPPAADAATMSEPSCGCGQCGPVRMGARPKVEVQDATGRIVYAPRPLVGVERFVAWGDTRDERARLDAELARALEATANDHRAELRRALDSGARAGALEDIRTRYTERYREVIEDAAARMRDAVQRWTIEEADRQERAPGLPDARRPLAPGETAGLTRAAGDALQRLTTGVELAAQDIAQRVQGELERWWLAGGAWSAFESRVALDLPARQVMQTVESDARVWTAAEMEQTGVADSMGLQIVGVLRTSVNDGSRCTRCEAKDGTEYDLPGQTAQWESDPVPDPLCEGTAERCRCGWLVVWGRPAQSA
jgi:hypothetical protein